MPQDDPCPYSHAYFPRRHFDQVLQRGHWTFGRKGSGYLGLYSQHPARWTEAPYAEIELRAEARDNIWLCELGAELDYGAFVRFIEAISAAPVRCEGLSVSYGSPSLGEVRFAWTGPLRVGEREIALSGYRRFDTPYCQAEVGERRYVVSHGADELVLDFQ